MDQGMQSHIGREISNSWPRGLKVAKTNIIKRNGKRELYGERVVKEARLAPGKERWSDPMGRKRSRDKAQSPRNHRNQRHHPRSGDDDMV